MLNKLEIYHSFIQIRHAIEKSQKTKIPKKDYLLFNFVIFSDIWHNLSLSRNLSANTHLLTCNF